jgi:hypothetical protein
MLQSWLDVQFYINRVVGLPGFAGNVYCQLYLLISLSFYLSQTKPNLALPRICLSAC